MAKLTDPVTSLPMVGTKYAKLLQKLDILSLYDLIHHYPFRHEDYSLISHINLIQAGEPVTLKTQIHDFSSYRVRSNLSVQKATATDSTGKTHLTWFNQPYLASQIKPDSQYYISGTAQTHTRNSLQIKSPSLELIQPNIPPTHTGRLVPIYPLTTGLSNKWLRSRIKQALSLLSDSFTEILPPELLKKHQLLDLTTAYPQIHFPSSQKHLTQAKFRLGVDELFTRQLLNLIAKDNWQNTHPATPIKLNSDQKKLVQKFIHSQPFTLTADQLTATSQIENDLTKITSMNRLLQGDVASGKTIVAATATYITYLAHQKTLILAPTTILAYQHYVSLKDSFKGIKSPPTISLITGQTDAKKRQTSSQADIIIGTHTLLHRKIPKNTGLVVVDEQHRFGVKQRGYFATHKTKLYPHILTMSATPIPRTILLSRYGHLSVSRLTSLPTGRQKITTWLVPNSKRKKAYHWIQQKLNKTSGQAYIICPFVDSSSSDTLENVKAATVEYEDIKTQFPDYQIGLVHGRMKNIKKNSVINQFHQKKINILVATPVIEVGIDNANAQIIVIEGAERFGLAQLHQLRGRVGRGELQSYCLIFASKGLDPVGLQRLDLLTKLNSGYELAEADLSLRGGGEMAGTSQHGFSEFKLADPSDKKQLATSTEITKEIYTRYQKGQLDDHLLETLDPDKIAQVSPN